MNIMIGDSITAWNPRKDVINCGIPGDTTRDILWRIDEIEISKDDDICLLVGINDILINIPDIKIIENYSKILEILIIKSKTIKVFSILPIVGEKLRNERVVSLNRSIEELCDKKEINFIDLHDKFIDDKGWLKASFTTDGIHLSTRGYELLNTTIDISLQNSL